MRFQSSKSLKICLDKQLPSALRIKVQNFFSFLPFVSPIDERINELRNLIDQAKINKQDYRYCKYYELHINYFLSNLKLFYHYSRKESAYTQSLRDGKNSFKNIKENLSPVTAKRNEVSLINSTKLFNSYLVQIESFLKEDNFQEKIEKLLKTLETKELHIKLAKELISQARAKPFLSKLTQSALIIIDKLNLEQEQLVSYVFDDLKNDQALDNYYFYLMQKAEAYKLTLLELIDDLGSSKASKEPCLYKLQRDFLQMKHPLNQLCDNGVIQEKEEAIDSFIKHFNLWRAEQQAKLTTTPQDVKIKTLLQQLTQCIEQIKFYIKILHKPILKDKYYQDQIAETKARKIYYDRKEFEEDLEYNRIDKISEQRLYELYPNDDDFIKQLQKCRQQGIKVFDAKELKHQEETSFSKASVLSI
ncbi:hypothetical protein [Legionella gresilensis]|uniref:hypothetical protein n=1 Tax=Legionella gresilensis TaxID=91823 RepID=UPI0013EF6B7A|nr:hypothetical protein [Legionella gresilensis]